MTDMTVIIKGAVEAASADLLKIVKDAQDVFTKETATLRDLAKAADQKGEDARKEVVAYGQRFGDTDAKLKELGENFSKSYGDVQKAVEVQRTAIEKLNELLNAPGGRGNDEADLKIAKSYEEFAKYRHYGEDIAAEFDPKVINKDAIAAYGRARDLFWQKAMRVPNNYGHIEQFLSPEDAKALEPLRINKTISTITHGNRFWLTNEMYGQVITCFDEVTDLSRLFSQVSISRGAIEVMRDNDVEKRALFKAEVNCNPGRNATTQGPGTIVIPTFELYDSECITHTMLEDSEIDLEGWLVPRVAEGFSRGRNEKFLHGVGVTEPEGLLRDGKHKVMNCNPINGSAQGEFTWQHLRIMPFQIAKKFQAGGSYMMSRDALMSLFTIADAQNRPLMDSAINVGADGVMRLWGYPVVQVDQLSNYLDEDSKPEVNSKPIGFGSWTSAYLVVDRKGFFVLRDPAYNPCGVTWHFGQRVGGGVLCDNASVFLKIV